MSSEWPIIELGNLVSVKGGKRLPKGSALQQSANSHPYIRIRDMGQRYLPSEGLEYVPDEVFPHIKRYIVEENDLLISIVGTVGLVCLIDERFHLASQTENAAKLTGLDSSDAQYLYYYLTSGVGQEEIKSRTVGAVQPKLPLYNIEKIPVVWPDECIRKEIVSQLSSLDDKIQLNRQINQTLEQMAQAIFQSWFVDFEPVKAKIAAKEDWLARQVAQSDAHDDAPQFSSPVCYANEFPDAAAPAPATQADLEAVMNRAAMCAISGKTDADLDSMPAADYQRLYHTASLFPDELVESELGEIPKGWEVKSLDQIANYQNGLALQKFRPEEGEDYLPVVKIAQLKKGYADGEERASVNITEKCIIDTGDVVFSWSGSLEVDIWCGGRAALNQHLFKVTSNTYPRWFYYLYTKHHLEDFQRIAKDKAVTMGHIKREHLSSAYCAISKNDLLGECDKAISALVDKTILNRVEINNLEKIRDSLLPKLLSGELDISALTDLAAATDAAEPGAAHV